MVHKGLALLFAGLLMVGFVGCPAEEEAVEPPVLEEQPIEEVIPEEPAEEGAIEAPAEEPAEDPE